MTEEGQIAGTILGSVVLSDIWIRKYRELHLIRITPYNDKYVNPASYDFSFSGLKSLTNPEHVSNEEEKQSGIMQILPNESFLASSLETIALSKNVAALVTLKSSIFRRGLSIGAVGWVDPGYTGVLTVLMTNTTNKVVTLKFLERMWNIIFVTVPSVSMPYMGKYQNSKGPQEEKKE